MSSHSSGQTGPGPVPKVYVGHLHPETSERTIHRIFSKYGRIVRYESFSLDVAIALMFFALVIRISTLGLVTTMTKWSCFARSSDYLSFFVSLAKLVANTGPEDDNCFHNVQQDDLLTTVVGPLNISSDVHTRRTLRPTDWLSLVTKNSALFFCCSFFGLYLFQSDFCEPLSLIIKDWNEAPILFRRIRRPTWLRRSYL